MRDTSQTSSAADIEHVGRAWLRDGTRDPYVLQQIFHAEEFNVSTAPQFAGVRANYERTLAAGDTPLVIDCGANIGLSSLYFAKHLPKARIIGIEPARQCGACSQEYRGQSVDRDRRSGGA
jgi:tRNA G46 methylase TrmB